MPLDGAQLFDFLDTLGKELPRRIILAAAGGTAMTLLGLKPSTRDVDFTGPLEDIEALKRALKMTPHGFKVDCWPGGQVFSQILPRDYLKKSIPVRRVKNIDLRALHPLDVVVTKIGRLDERDLEDIEACIKGYRLTKTQVLRRAKGVEYVGNQEIYDYNLQYTIRRFFGNVRSGPGQRN